MAIRHLPYTVVMVLIGLCPLLLLFIDSYQIQSTLFVLFLVMGFGVIAYCNSFFLVKIFDHYMPKEENEEQKNIRNCPGSETEWKQSHPSCGGNTR